jgi:hypothetical protein
MFKRGILDCQQLIDTYISDNSPEGQTFIKNCQNEITKFEKLIDDLRNNDNVILTINDIETIKPC